MTDDRICRVHRVNFCLLNPLSSIGRTHATLEQRVEIKSLYARLSEIGEAIKGQIETERQYGN